MTTSPLDPEDNGEPKDDNWVIHNAYQHPNTPAYRRGCDICDELDERAEDYYGPEEFDESYDQDE